MKRIIVTIFTIIISVLAVYGSVYFTLNTPSLDPVVVEKTPEPVKFQDERLKQLLVESGVTVPKDIGLAYVESFSQPTARGQYLNGDVTIKVGLEPQAERRVLVHEYLHYVWFRVMTPEQKLSLSDKLLTVFAGDPAMQERLYRYVELDALTSTELFSFYCTEVNDAFIALFVAECNKYFDRSTIQLLR